MRGASIQSFSVFRSYVCWVGQLTEPSGCEPKSLGLDNLKREFHQLVGPAIRLAGAPRKCNQFCNHLAAELAAKISELNPPCQPRCPYPRFAELGRAATEPPVPESGHSLKTCSDPHRYRHSDWCNPRKSKSRICATH